MKAISIIVGTLMGVYIGGAVAYLIMPYTATDEYTAMGYVIVCMPLGAVLGGAAGAYLGWYLYAALSRERSRAVPHNRVAWISFAIPCGCLIFVAAAFHSPLNHNIPPSDECMLANFRRDRPVFQQVVATLGKDTKGDVIHYPYGDKSPEVTAAYSDRLALCARLLRQAGMSVNFDVDTEPGGVSFNYWKAVPLSRDWEASKTYVYRANSPHNLRSSLDEYSPGGKTEIQAYRHIEGDWYLLYYYYHF